MSDHATTDLLKAEAERSQDLIQGLREAADKLIDRITVSDTLAARYQAEREAARLKLGRYRLAVVAAVRASRNDRCLSPSSDATLWEIETFLGIDRDEPSTPEEDELAKALEALPHRDPKDAAACTGLTASWCPVHGACACGREDGMTERLDDLDDPDCPLHNEMSAHAEDVRRELSLGYLRKADEQLADLVQDGGKLSPDQAERFRKIHDAGMETCAPCGGSGSMLISGGPLKLIHRLPQKCPGCDGTGQVPAADMVVCGHCSGTGGPDITTGGAECLTCGGKGEIERPKPKGDDDAKQDRVRDGG